jgi:hypothetical protein
MRQTSRPLSSRGAVSAGRNSGNENPDRAAAAKAPPQRNQSCARRQAGMKTRQRDRDITCGILLALHVTGSLA